MMVCDAWWPNRFVAPCRRIAIVSACLDSSSFAASMAAAEFAPPCDILVHSMCHPPGTPAGAGGSSQPADGPLGAAAMAGACGAALGAKDLVLWQQQASFLDSAAGADEGFPEAAVAAARAALGHANVALAGSFWCHEPVREEGGRPAWAQD
jgi:hypothetical protein